jgi:hypothetical protein
MHISKTLKYFKQLILRQIIFITCSLISKVPQQNVRGNKYLQFESKKKIAWVTTECRLVNPENSSEIIPKPAALGHDPDPVTITSQSHNLFAQNPSFHLHHGLWGGRFTRRFPTKILHALLVSPS